MTVRTANVDRLLCPICNKPIQCVCGNPVHHSPDEDGSYTCSHPRPSCSCPEARRYLVNGPAVIHKECETAFKLQPKLVQAKLKLKLRDTLLCAVAADPVVAEVLDALMFGPDKVFYANKNLNMTQLSKATGRRPAVIKQCLQRLRQSILTGRVRPLEPPDLPTDEDECPNQTCPVQDSTNPNL